MIFGEASNSFLQVGDFPPVPNYKSQTLVPLPILWNEPSLTFLPYSLDEIHS